MIYMQTVVDVADNSGAKIARCIRVMGGTGRRCAGIGDIIMVSIQKSAPGAPDFAKKGKIARAVIVRTKQPTRRQDGSYVRFDKNAIVLIDADDTPRGTRIFGAVARELRERKFTKILSLASEVV